MPGESGDGPLTVVDGLAIEALRSLSFPVVLVSGQGMVLFINEAACHCRGAKAADCLNRPVWDVLFEQRDAERVRRTIVRCVAEGGEMSLEAMRSARGFVGRIRWQWTCFQAGNDRAAMGVAFDREAAATIDNHLLLEETSARTLLKATFDLIFRIDRQGHFLEVYAAHERLLFVSPEEIVGRTVRELIPEPVASQMMDSVYRALDTGSVDTNQYSLPVAPGHLYYEARQIAVGADEVLGVVRDITRRKLSEQALRDSEQQYRTLMRRASDAIVLMDAVGQVVAVNHQACEMTGWREDALLSRNVAELLSVQGGASITSLLREWTEEPTRVDVRLRRRDGGWLDIEMSASRMPDGRVQAILRDVTERKRAQDALERSERSFRLLIERAPNLIAVHQAGRVVWVNDAFSKSFRLDKSELIGRRVVDLVHPDDWDAVLSRMRKQEETAVPSLVSEERFLREDGTFFWTEAVGIPLDFQGVPSSIMIAHDVTERKRAEEERRVLEQRIQQTQTLQSLGLLAGGIAHDFNNLLMGVLGNASLALLDLPDDHPARHYLQRIEATAQRAAELTKQLLAYSGKGQFLIAPIDLTKVVEEMNHLLTTVISKRARVQLELESDLPSIEADITQVRQIVMNLITNASDALEGRDGTIVVRTGVMHADTAYLASTYIDERLDEGEYVFLEISDTGHGMDRATIGRIFDPFFTTRFTGRGLGLAAVLGIVRAHRGAIRVHSELGHGTTFRVLFPKMVRQVEKDLEIAQEHAASGSGTILLVDDESIVRTVARLVLERLGFSVVEAENGMEAVEVYRTHLDRFRLVILDMTMPRMDGEEAYRALRSIEPKVRVLLSSGYDEREMVHRLEPGDAPGFLQKPYTPSELTEAVFRMLGDSKE